MPEWTDEQWIQATVASTGLPSSDPLVAQAAAVWAINDDSAFDRRLQYYMARKELLVWARDNRWLWHDVSEGGASESLSQVFKNLDTAIAGAIKDLDDYRKTRGRGRNTGSVQEGETDAPWQGPDCGRPDPNDPALRGHPVLRFVGSRRTR